MDIISAVLFDLDGLLADTEDLHVKAYGIAFAKCGIALSDEEIYRGMGVSTRENVKRIFREHNLALERLEEIVALRYDSYYNLVQSTPISFMDGAADCLQYVKEKGLRSALVTSSIKKHGIAVLTNLQEHADLANPLPEYFDVQVFGDEIKRSKPDPEIYLEALERLNIPPETCIAFEDSEVGVLSAKSAGLSVFAVPNKYTARHSYDKADRVIGSLGDIVRHGLLN
jgi:beta-phosphoglucomutase